MKRFFLLMLSIWRQQLKLYLTVALTGAIIGIFVLAPSYDYIYAREQTIDPLSSIEYVLKQIASLFTGNLSDESAALLIFYAEIGAMLGLLTLVLYKFIHQRLVNIDHLKTELDKDLLSIIQKGEGSYLEFKSSLRWDMVESRVNRSLEGVVLKTLAGFLNSHLSGTLLIGVSDDGQIIGLDKDYQTLKKPNQDGFEQNLMAAISNNLGTDLCQFVHVLFHVIDNNEVCRLIISPAPRPVFLDQGNTPKFFVRTGGGTRDLNIREALDYIHGRWKRVK
ncbi:MAG: ATP-binding protein [Methylobacter sp.]|nr:ATP-binding protein [Methylobacter sp.]